MILFLLGALFFNIVGYAQIKKYLTVKRTKEDTSFKPHPWQVYQQDYEIQVNRGQAATKFAWIYLANGIFYLFFGIPLLVFFILSIVGVF